MPVKSYYVQTALSNFHSTGLTLRLPTQNTGQDTGRRAVKPRGGGEAAHFQVPEQGNAADVGISEGADVFISCAVL